MPTTTSDRIDYIISTLGDEERDELVRRLRRRGTDPGPDQGPEGDAVFLFEVYDRWESTSRDELFSCPEHCVQGVLDVMRDHPLFYGVLHAGEYRAGTATRNISAFVYRERVLGLDSRQDLTLEQRHALAQALGLHTSVGRWSVEVRRLTVGGRGATDWKHYWTHTGTVDEAKAYATTMQENHDWVGDVRVMPHADGPKMLIK